GDARRRRLRLRHGHARDGHADDDHGHDFNVHDRHDHDDALMAKKLDPKAKAKREKVIAAVAGVVLLGVLAFAVPMTMKQLKAQNATPAAAPAPAAAATTTPTVATDLASATGSSVGLGQLDSLGRF